MFFTSVASAIQKCFMQQMFSFSLHVVILYYLLHQRKLYSHCDLENKSARLLEILVHKRI